MPLLAALLVALRLFLPLQVPPQVVPPSAAAPAPHAHPAEGSVAAHAEVGPGAGSQDDGHSAGDHAQTCHFCRLFDPVVPPPDLRPAVPSRLVAVKAVLAPSRPSLPRPCFMEVVRPRAPPTMA
jgi:hypothetical protein